MILGQKFILPDLQNKTAPVSARIHWRNALSGFENITTFPAHFNRQESQNRISLSFKLDAEITGKLLVIGKGSPLSDFVVFASVMAVWLSRVTGDQKLVYAVPQPNGGKSQPMVLLVALAGNMTFEQVLLAVRKQLIEGFIHAYKGDAITPFIGLEYSSLFPTGTLNNEFSFRFKHNVLDITGEVHFDANKFDARVIGRLLENFVFVFRQLLSFPTHPIDRLDLICQNERTTLLREFNSLRKAYALDATIGELFEQQAARTPDRIAAEHGKQTIDYRTMNERANQIAWSLREMGVGKNQFVALFHPRNLDFIAALLGILKSGAAYVPIDPEYPSERVSYMLSNSGAETVITDALGLSVLEQDGGLRNVILTSVDAALNPAGFKIMERKLIDLLSRSNLPVVASCTDLAYLLYTSGSTGEPKGAMIRHDGALNHIFAQFDALEFHADSAFLQSAPSSSDISVWQFLGPLLLGAKTVIADRETLCDGKSLRELIQQKQITIIELVPSVLLELLNDAETCGAASRGFPCLEYCMATGDEISVQLVNRWLSLYPGIPLVNAYGPTEASDDICQAIIRNTLPPAQKSVSIGKPLTNLSLYVLGRNLELLPLGAVGEICVSGVGVGIGYWKNKDKTATAFVGNPFSEEGRGDTLYKTGDLGRWSVDGSLEFLGRRDQQIKLRGYRIELGEIEAAANACDEVQEAAALLVGESTSRQIVAFVIPRKTQDTLSFGKSLKSFLQSKLPAPMVPSVICVLESFPRLGNGKIDRHALPSLLDRSVSDSYKAPETEHEKALATIWGQILKKSKVGKEDNFFASGGDSISSMQLVSKARQAGLAVTVAQIFRFPVLEHLAAHATSQTRKLDVTLRGADPRESQLTPIQCWFFEQNFAHPHHYNQSVMLKVAVGVNFDRLKKAWKQVVDQHPALTSCFVNEKKGWVQRFGTTIPVEMEEVKIGNQSGGNVQRVIAAKVEEDQRSLKLEGPLCRATLFSCPAAEGRLFLTAHHLVVDGVSWRIIIEDLGSAYMNQPGNIEGESQLPSSTFGACSEYCQNIPNRQAKREELNYWISQLTGHGLSIPRDQTEQLEPVEKFSEQKETRFSRETTERLLAAPAVYKARIDELLLTAFVRAVLGFSGQETLLVEMEGHGRHWQDADLSRSVGWFTSLFPILFSLKGEFSAGRDLALVKDACRAVPDEGIGFGLLRHGFVDQSAQEALSQLAPPRVCFNYLGRFDNLFSNALFTGQAEEKIGCQSSPENKSTYDWEMNAMITGSELHVLWNYNRQLHSEQTMTALVANFQNLVHQLLEHCESPGAGGSTASDFPGARLSAEKLGSFMKKLGKTSQA